MLLLIIALISLLSAVSSCLLSGAFLGLSWLWILPVGFIGTFLGLALLYFLFLCILAALVDPDKPQETDSKLYRTVITLTARAVFPILGVRMHLQGLEKVPKDGRFMLVCNHIHILDPVVLLARMPQAQLAFISKRENRSMFLVASLCIRSSASPSTGKTTGRR